MDNKDNVIGERYYNKGYGLPEGIKYCTRCIVSNQRPRITFDSNGVCSACNYADYKKNRVYDDSFMGGPFFEMAYKEDLFLQGGAKIILEHESLEADDCVALTTKHILSLYPDAHIWIITSDMDYLQLSEENVHLYNLKFKKLTDSKTSFNDPKKDLFCKIVTGDKSDCIPSIFKRCGLKTASKYYENKMLFMEKLVEKHAKIRFALNRKLIDFNEIPKELVSEFNLKYGFV